MPSLLADFSKQNLKIKFHLFLTYICSSEQILKQIIFLPYFFHFKSTSSQYAEHNAHRLISLYNPSVASLQFAQLLKSGN
jgi:hypothetical protein